MESDIIDEFQFTISPVILGKGKTFIRNLGRKISLERLSEETVEGGVIGLRYKVLH